MSRRSFNRTLNLFSACVNTWEVSIDHDPSVVLCWYICNETVIFRYYSLFEMHKINSWCQECLMLFFLPYLFLISEVKFAVTSQIKYTMQAFWVVSIRELHVSLWRPWKELQDALKDVNGTILEASHCQKLATDIR